WNWEGWHGNGNRARVAVTRKDHSDFRAEVRQRFRQPLDHVRQPACLRKRQPFRCDKEYFHTKPEASNLLKQIAPVKNASDTGFSLRFGPCRDYPPHKLKEAPVDS